MAPRFFCSACLILAAGTIVPGASWDLSEGFTSYLEANSAWKGALREAQTARLARQAGEAVGPTLEFSAKGAGYNDIRGTVATLPIPDLILLSLPIDLSVTTSLMLWDPTAGDLSNLNRLDDGRSDASLADYRRDLYADYLVSVANYAAAVGLARIRQATADTYAGLEATANRRFNLGAGNRKDLLRAQVASLQARSSTDQALHQAEVIRGAWPLPLRQQWPADSPVDPGDALVWTGLFRTAGVDVGFLFGGSDPNSGSLPTAQDRQVDSWDERRAQQKEEAARRPVRPTVSWYAEGDFNATPDLSGTVTWESILQTGIKLTWTPFSASRSPKAPDLAHRQASDQAETLADQKLDRTRTLGTLESDWKSKVAVWKQRVETRQRAVSLDQALQVEMDGGTATLDLLLQGSQLESKAREDEWSARWDAVSSLLVYLKAAGRLTPGGTP